MAYGETKVYFDGSHYIAIPHTERPKRYRPKPVEEKITVADANEDLPRAERHYKVMDGMEPYFDTIEQLKWYVDLGFERKHKNMVYRRIRMVRKARLARFNYFCTFTYSDEKHTEESFKKALQTCLRNLCYRKEWKYMGVWERSPEKQRLHFHGLFYIPENAMVGELFEKTDYDLRNHRMRTTVQFFR